ncbi:jg27844, partial [Pararge aegeria aegeria]
MTLLPVYKRITIFLLSLDLSLVYGAWRSLLIVCDSDALYAHPSRLPELFVCIRKITTQLNIVKMSEKKDGTGPGGEEEFSVEKILDRRVRLGK